MEHSEDSLYHRDYLQWVQQQKQLLINRQFDQLDIDHLIEEVEDMGSELDTLESRLTTLLLHLLKYQYQTEVVNPVLPEPYNCRNWKGAIREQRKQLIRLMKKKPHLKSLITEAMSEAYTDGKELAIEAMNDYVQPHQRLDNRSFPSECPWTFDRIMEEGWLP